MHFGHDGAVSIIKDGKVLSYISRERNSRVKHAIGITTNELDLALEEAQIKINDIDYCTVVSTQNMEILNGLINDFHISFDNHKDHTNPSPLKTLFKESNINVSDLLSFQLKDLFQSEKLKDSLQYKNFSKACPEKERIANNSLASTGYLDNYVMLKRWKDGTSLNEMAMFDASSFLENEKIKNGFHYPVSISLRGKSIAGYFINHHIAHAASCYYSSGFQDSAIITHDGFGNGVGYHSGLILYGKDNILYPLSPNHLSIGSLYKSVAILLNLGGFGEGKLMGLAPYGKPHFFHQDFVENWFGVGRRFKKANQLSLWKEYCRTTAKNMGYNMDALGDKDKITDPINVDIAASTQKLFEECYLYAARMSHNLLTKSGIDTNNLCLTGGTALNCPSNSKVYNEGPFDNLFIEPSCSDEGLAVGSALYLYHHIQGNKLSVKTDNTFISPYFGRTIKEDKIIEALKAFESKITYKKTNDTAKQAAQDVFSNRVIAWHEGKSEIGPRALGHRSLVSNPTYKDNWKRVNKIKQREWWRPFAPSVLEEEAEKWFSNMPFPSPYMLFTGQVINSEKIPAITHVDNSSRIQTVNKSSGQYYEMIKEFYKLSKVPLVMNTSFNGPGEPIIETPEQALNFLLNTELDVLYIDGYRVQRKG